jgi:UDP-galactopyranose mutase
MYDWLIVGAGLFGSVFAHEATKRGLKVLVIDRRDHIAGNCYTKDVEGIPVHWYGPHVFHTNKKHIWDYMNQFADFNNYQHRVKANFEGKIYSLPINLMTLHQLWGVTTPEEAKAKLESVRIPFSNPRSLEDWALSQVGEELYEKFIKGYTTKQWQREPKDLPSSIIKRLPIRMTYNDHYFPDEDRWEGIPIGGYTQIFEKLLEGSDVRVSTDYLADPNHFKGLARKTLYTGCIDEYYGYSDGKLEYRTLRLDHEVVDGDFQGSAIINYTSMDVPWTRITEHKHFEFLNTPKSVITREYSLEYDGTGEPYYPINDTRNNDIYDRYVKRAEGDNEVVFGGRLASYKYYDMDMCIAAALTCVRRNLD